MVRDQKNASWAVCHPRPRPSGYHPPGPFFMKAGSFLFSKVITSLENFLTSKVQNPPRLSSILHRFPIGGSCSYRPTLEILGSLVLPKVLPGSLLGAGVHSKTTSAQAGQGAHRIAWWERLAREWCSNHQANAGKHCFQNTEFSRPKVPWGSRTLWSHVFFCSLTASYTR